MFLCYFAPLACYRMWNNMDKSMLWKVCLQCLLWTLAFPVVPILPLLTSWELDRVGSLYSFSGGNYSLSDATMVHISYRQWNQKPPWCFILLLPTDLPIHHSWYWWNETHFHLLTDSYDKLQHYFLIFWPSENHLTNFNIISIEVWKLPCSLQIMND